MKVVILCGGQGTRLREETEFRPKPMVPIGGRPILWHIMKSYAHYGFKDFILCLGYRGNDIKEYFLNYEAMNNDFTICLGEKHKIQYHNLHGEQDFCVTLAQTGEDNMTGSRIKQIEKYIGDDENFMVTYGDGVSDIDIAKLVDFHTSHGRAATVTAMRPRSRFGALEIAEDFSVSDFSEKPTSEGWSSAGHFVFNKSFFTYLSDDPECVMEHSSLKAAAKDNQLMAHQHDGFFFAMDTYRESLQLNEMWQEGNTPWVPWKDSSPSK